MSKLRTCAKSSERLAGLEAPAAATILASGVRKRIPGPSVRRERAISIEGDTPQARWRFIEQGTAQDPGWQTGVRTLASILHKAAEQQPTEKMRDVADAFAELLYGMTAKVAADVEVAVTDEQASDIGSALFAAALTYVERLPFVEIGKPS